MGRRDLETLFVDPHATGVPSEDSTHFDHLAYASRALEGTAFSAFESNAAEAAIFAQLDGSTGTQEPGDLNRQEPGDLNRQEPGDLKTILGSPSANTNRRLLGAFAAIALALLIIPIVLSEDRQTSSWQSRSAQTVPSKSVPQVHIYCVRQNEETIDFIGQHESAFGVISCLQGDDLKIAYENPNPSLRFGYFVGLSATGETLWYGPTPSDSTPFSVHVTSEPTPLGETRRLAVNHSPGRYDVLGVFSQRPLTFVEFESLVARQKINGARTESSDIVVVRAEFEVKP